MQAQIHILNGDALLEQFPSDLAGKRIVLRECLIDGPVQADTIKALYEIRAQFLMDEYALESREAYHQKSIVEFDKILSIQEGAEINLWFEEDLFCQTNLWFALHLLHLSARDNGVYLVRPDKLSPYGFGAYKPTELSRLFEQRSLVTERVSFAKLWQSYQEGDLARLQHLAESMSGKYPFLKAAVQAHLNRLPTSNDMGLPYTIIETIIKELNTKEFGVIFQEFNKRLPIYGFGDIQVKRMFDQVLSEMKK